MGEVVILRECGVRWRGKTQRQSRVWLGNRVQYLSVLWGWKRKDSGLVKVATWTLQDPVLYQTLVEERYPLVMVKQREMRKWEGLVGGWRPEEGIPSEWCSVIPKVTEKAQHLFLPPHRRTEHLLLWLLYYTLQSTNFAVSAPENYHQNKKKKRKGIDSKNVAPVGVRRHKVDPEGEWGQEGLAGLARVTYPNILDFMKLLWSLTPELVFTFPSLWVLLLTSTPDCTGTLEFHGTS